MIRLDRFALRWVGLAERLAHRGIGPVTSSFNEWVGVSAAGEFWDVGPYRLWRSTDPQTLLYVAREPALALAADGRAAAEVHRSLRWQEGGFAATGGLARLTATLFPPLDEADRQRLLEAWRRAGGSGGSPGPADPVIRPLPVCDVEFHVDLDPELGTQVSAAPGATSVAVALTARGADELARAVAAKSPVPGTLRCSYRYLRLLPEAEGSVIVHGAWAYDSLRRALAPLADDSVGGTAYEVRVAWESLARTGAVEVALAGPLPPGVESHRGEIVATFVRMAGEQLFETLFAPVPAPSNGAGPVYALRWRQPADAVDLRLALRVEGWRWVEAGGGAPLAAVLAPLDATAIDTAYEEVAVPVTVVVGGDPLLTGASVTLTFSDGRPPETAVFGPTGGAASYVVATPRPDLVTVRYAARIDFRPAHWPAVEHAGSIPLAGDGRIVIRPADWVRRRSVSLYVRDGNRILPPGKGDPSDYLLLTTSIEAPYLPAPIRQSARVTTGTTAELCYPQPPGAGPAVARLTALGMVAGQVVRSTSSLAVHDTDESILLLAGRGEVGLYGHRTDARKVFTPAGCIATGGPDPDGEPAAVEGWRDVDLPVALVPQPTGMTGWAACLAMVVNHRDRADWTVVTVALEAGLDLRTGYAWDEIRRAVRAWDLVEEEATPATPAGWAQRLRAWGPVWVVEAGAPYHGAVIGGVAGDGTREGTVVTLYNPWPPNVGAVQRQSVAEFEQEYCLGVGLRVCLVRAR